MAFREYEQGRDRAAAHRIWREVGWIGPDAPEDVPERYVLGGRGLVAEIDGEAEVLVFTAPGDVQYIDERLAFGCVCGVTTSVVARKQGIAGRLTAEAVARCALDGAMVCGLGAFELGYYNRLGFGTGPYEHRATLDPSAMLIDAKARPPLRLGRDDIERVHACRLRRRRCHGSCSLLPPTTTEEFCNFNRASYGLGYADGPGGELSHALWLGPEGEQGPHEVGFLAYETNDQLRELLAVLKSLGDQLYSLRLPEPPGVQVQDLVDKPFRHYGQTKGGKHEMRVEAYAWWQMRICDLAGCLARTHLAGPAVCFNLRLDDPIARFLDEGTAWRGVGGEYMVTLGPECAAEAGADPALPTLEASVGAFTRLWLGVRPARGLAFTDRLSGPEGLLRDLERALGAVPEPHVNWAF